MLKEFKTFIMRGNVLDLAIGKSSEPPSGGSRLNEEVDHRYVGLPWRKTMGSPFPVST